MDNYITELNSTMPRVSVIMPVYNAARYLKEAIGSIVGQTYTDWELIIINDGSTDESNFIIGSYSDSRIRHYENGSNLGLIATLNRAINLCRGEYIARMDADDISLPERISSQLEFMEKNPEYAICGTNARIINEAGNTTGKILNLESNEYLQINLLFSVPFIHPSVMIRADVLKSNIFDSNFKHAEDYELWCRIARDHQVANISTFLLEYRWHNTNVSVIHKETQEKIKDKIICRELKERLNLNPTEEELYLHKVSFKQKDVKEKGERKVFRDFNDLDDWFLNIKKANQEFHQYSPNSLTAYLWSRWIVLCISQKKYARIFKPRFLNLSPDILYRTFRLLLFFSKK